MADFFKDLVYSKEDIITFPAGVPGFEKNKTFVLVQVPITCRSNGSCAPTARA